MERRSSKARPATWSMTAPSSMSIWGKARPTDCAASCRRKMPVLEVEGVKAGYADRIVLQSVDLTLGEGELAAIVGPNGHGKTTLLKAISGLVRASAGEIRFAGQRIDTLRPDQ